MSVCMGTKSKVEDSRFRVRESVHHHVSCKNARRSRRLREYPESVRSLTQAGGQCSLHPRGGAGPLTLSAGPESLMSIVMAEDILLISAWRLHWLLEINPVQL